MTTLLFVAQWVTRQDTQHRSVPRMSQSHTHRARMGRGTDWRWNYY